MCAQLERGTYRDRVCERVCVCQSRVECASVSMRFVHCQNLLGRMIDKLSDLGQGKGGGVTAVSGMGSPRCTDKVGRRLYHLRGTHLQAEWVGTPAGGHGDGALYLGCSGKGEGRTH